MIIVRNLLTRSLQTRSSCVRPQNAVNTIIIINLEIPKIFDTNKNITTAVYRMFFKIFGAGEWCEVKHGMNKQHHWIKLHIISNTIILEVIEVPRTENSVSDIIEANNHLELILKKLG